MKGNRRKSIVFLVGLLVLLAGVFLLYFPGCVAIPENAWVISGSADIEIQRASAACRPDEQPAALHKGSAGIDPDGFSILSWNAHKGKHGDWQKDFSTLGGRTDFILLQEAVLDDRLREELGRLSRQWLFALAFQLAGKEIGILSASPISPLDYCALREPEPLILIPKIALAATYQLRGRIDELLIVNVHMVNFTLGSEVVRHQVEAMQKLISSHQGPVIVAGDFNTWNEERLGLIRSAMSSLGMQPVGFSPDHRVTFFEHHVDGVYYRGLEVTDSISYQVKSSDHNPLEVHFRLDR